MSMTPQELATHFYQDVWNSGDEAMAMQILAHDFQYRGSLGTVKRGPEAFIEHMQTIRKAVGNYSCSIEELMAEGERVVARMTFRGVHKGVLYGVDGSGRPLRWAGVAFFTISNGKIRDLWVLGDVDGVKQQLGVESYRSLLSTTLRDGYEEP